HSIMPFSVPKAFDKAKETLRKALFGESIAYEVPNSPYNKKGSTTGILVGGNLSILYSLLGSKSAIDTTDKILFMEDLDEYLYHVDRMMMNLKRNGYFERVRGIIVGGMTDMHDNSIPFGRNASEIILDITQEYNIPICFDFPAGHLPDNRALIFGKEICFEVGDSTQVKFMSNDKIMAQHNELGKLGEGLDIKYLTTKGFVIREKNWRFQKAEVDIIAQEENLLIAVEVKTRSSVDFGSPEEFVNSKKIKL